MKRTPVEGESSEVDSEQSHEYRIMMSHKYFTEHGSEAGKADG